MNFFELTDAEKLWSYLTAVNLGDVVVSCPKVFSGSIFNRRYSG
jgi:hypothetical protein